MNRETLKQHLHNKPMVKKEKPPVREQDTRNKLTLRISPELDMMTKSKAEYIGVSQNAFLAMLIDLGLRYYEANPFPVDE